MEFITDRSQTNLNRLEVLTKKGWANMTASERAEWSGDPARARDLGEENPVNLANTRAEYVSNVTVTRREKYVRLDITETGVYPYAVAILGESGLFEGETVTLTVGSIYGSGTAKPYLALNWYNSPTDAASAGITMTEAGSLTAELAENTGGRGYLALCLYGTDYNSTDAGTYAQFTEIMLEFGSEGHDYVPYVGVLPTEATKGAYNYSDLNRVEMAVAELAEAHGLALETKTDWGPWDVPTEADMERYLKNVAYIRAVCGVEGSRPGDMSGLTTEGANQIEALLEAAYAYTWG